MKENLYNHLIGNEEIIREAMSIARIGIWKWDLKYHAVSWSDEMYDIFEIDKRFSEEKLKQEIMKVIHPDDIDIFDNVKQIMTKTPFEYRIIHSDKSIHYIQSKAGNIIFDDHGEPSFLVGTVQEITEQKEAQLALIAAKEYAEEENASKSHFFATMSHEFRTPINVLLSSVQLFEQYITDVECPNYDKIKKHLKSMKQSSLRLLRLVNNLIDISKIDTGYYSSDIKTYNIVSVVEKIVLSVQDFAKYKNMRISFQPRVKEALVRCDADMMERIMLNLISNAIKFSDKDCTIKIRLYPYKDGLMISVKDNGIGIEKDKMELIFQRYHQVQTTLTRKSEGSGIGLAITKSLTELMGGTIMVKSRPGKGSEFIIKMPLVIYDRSRNDTEIKEIVSDHQNIVLKMNVEFSDIYI